MDKWEELKLLLKADMSHVVHYSNDKYYEHSVTKRHLEMMEQLERKEKINDALEIIDELHGDTLRRLDDKPKGFLYTDVPEFDRATWKKMLKNLEGLS